MESELRGQRVLVVGLGRSGVAAARLLLDQGARVVGNDLRSLNALSPEARALQERGATLELGQHDPQLFRRVDRIVVSPGVPPLPALEAAESGGVPIVSEISLAASFVRSTLIGITGTNGKSTVTELVGEMCRASGRPTFVGGNLGIPLSEAVGTPAAQEGGYAVVELSSFQLERVPGMRVNAAALLNVTDDHLDRYSSIDAYAAAKGEIFRHQEPGDFAIVPSGDARCEALARTGRGQLLRFGGQDGDVRVVKGTIFDPSTGFAFATDGLAITGKHNLDNACAAVLLARAAGVPSSAMDKALCVFSGLPHRMQHVRALDGVDYFDDSKATNVGATVAALEGLSDRPGRVVLIAGGKDKGGSYEPVASAMKRVGRAVVLIGEATPLIERALRGASYPVERAQTLEAAVERARALALPGDAVLLAPACASFDMFRSYAHRGDVFVQAVNALPAQSKTEGNA
jgi:UDP-N-acetylmuramoylalanine--D-glutamate ligase